MGLVDLLVLGVFTHHLEFHFQTLLLQGPVPVLFLYSRLDLLDQGSHFLYLFVAQVGQLGLDLLEPFVLEVFLFGLFHSLDVPLHLSRLQELLLFAQGFSFLLEDKEGLAVFGSDRKAPF